LHAQIFSDKNFLICKNDVDFSNNKQNKLNLFKKAFKNFFISSTIYLKLLMKATVSYENYEFDWSTESIDQIKS